MTLTSAEYWERRYRRGGNSGAGSYGRLQEYKAQFVRRFVELNHVADVMDFGCGDGNFAVVADLTSYTGLDVSALVVASNRARFADRPTYKFHEMGEVNNLPRHDLTLSLDVIYHLIEDEKFEEYIDRLFALAKRFVVIYSSNTDARIPGSHVRHRHFTPFIARTMTDWQLAAHVPNIYPYDRSDVANTSFADFYVYRRPGEDCVVELPAPSGQR